MVELVDDVDPCPAAELVRIERHAHAPDVFQPGIELRLAVADPQPELLQHAPHLAVRQRELVEHDVGSGCMILKITDSIQFYKALPSGPALLAGMGFEDQSVLVTQTTQELAPALSTLPRAV